MATTTQANSYLVAGLVIEAPESIPSLVPADSPADFVIGWGDGPPAPGRLLRNVEHDGSAWIRIEAVDGGISYAFPGLGVFVVQSGSRRVICCPDAGTQVHTMWHLLLDQVLPLHLVSQGEFVLHASSVATGDVQHNRAILFLGESGAGKSSTAIGCALAGATLLGDDFARISLDVDPPAVAPANVGVRLWEKMVAAISLDEPSVAVAEYTSKRRVFPSDASSTAVTDSVAIGALVFLGPRLPSATEPLLETISAAQAFMLLLEGSYRLTVAAPEERLRVMDQAAHLVNSVPSVRLQMPENVDDLRSSCVRVLELIQEVVQHSLALAR
jgi:hypothetical protein